MTRLTPLLTSKKTLNITYQTPQETLLDTPETLPTSEPTTPQIGYTVQSSHLPTLSLLPYSKKWAALVIGAGKCVTAATIYWRMKKNGASVATSSTSVSANYYYTVVAYFFDVAVDDVLELALWSNQADSNWDYKAFQVQVTRIIPFNKPRLLMPCNFAAVTVQPVLTLGNPSVSVNDGFYAHHLDKSLAQISAATLLESLFFKDTYGLFRISYGDITSNTTYATTHSTSRPRHRRNYVPTQIIMRGVKID
jgi:hypothetical protein